MLALLLGLATCSAIFVPADEEREAVDLMDLREASVSGREQQQNMARRRGAARACAACASWVIDECNKGGYDSYKMGLLSLPMCPCEGSDLVDRRIPMCKTSRGLRPCRYGQRQDGGWKIIWKESWSEDGACKVVECQNGSPPPGHCDPFHTGAAYCTRGTPHGAFNRGQQCCYDCNDRLIICPEGGAGTTDAYPGVAPWIAHVVEDVVPFGNCCKKADFIANGAKYRSGRPMRDFHCKVMGVPACSYYFVLRPSNFGRSGYNCCYNEEGEGESGDPRCPCYKCSGNPFSDHGPPDSQARAFFACKARADFYNRFSAAARHPRTRDCSCCDHEPHTAPYGLIG